MSMEVPVCQVDNERPVDGEEDEVAHFKGGRLAASSRRQQPKGLTCGVAQKGERHGMTTGDSLDSSGRMASEDLRPHGERHVNAEADVVVQWIIKRLASGRMCMWCCTWGARARDPP
jgi:hypothetical protein